VGVREKGDSETGDSNEGSKEPEDEG